MSAKRELLKKSAKPVSVVDAKEKIATFMAQRKQAYVESFTAALCHNPHITENLAPAEIVEKAVEVADAVLNTLYLKPIQEKVGEEKKEE